MRKPEFFDFFIERTERTGDFVITKIVEINRIFMPAKEKGIVKNVMKSFDFIGRKRVRLNLRTETDNRIEAKVIHLAFVISYLMGRSKENPAYFRKFHNAFGFKKSLNEPDFKRVGYSGGFFDNLGNRNP